MAYLKREMKSRTDLRWVRSASWAAMKYEAMASTRLLVKYEPVGFTINVPLLCMQIKQWGKKTAVTLQLLQGV